MPPADARVRWQCVGDEDRAELSRPEGHAALALAGGRRSEQPPFALAHLKIPAGPSETHGMKSAILSLAVLASAGAAADPLHVSYLVDRDYLKAHVVRGA